MTRQPDDLSDMPQPPRHFYCDIIGTLDQGRTLQIEAHQKKPVDWDEQFDPEINIHLVEAWALEQEEKISGEESGWREAAEERCKILEGQLLACGLERNKLALSVADAALEVARLKGELAEWVAANAPGGWIDDLRKGKK